MKCPKCGSEMMLVVEDRVHRCESCGFEVSALTRGEADPKPPTVG